MRQAHLSIRLCITMCDMYDGCRGPAETQQQQPAAVSDVVREPRRDGASSQQEFGGQRGEERVTGGEIQARIQQVRAAIEAAKAANQPDILRTQVHSHHDCPCFQARFYLHVHADDTKGTLAHASHLS